MIEFLVRRTDGEWFDFPKGSDPYRPVTLPFRRIESWGDSRIEVDGCPISFSYEDPGIQITFEGTIAEPRAVEIVEEIRQRIEEVSGQGAATVQISG